MKPTTSLLTKTLRFLNLLWVQSSPCFSINISAKFLKSQYLAIDRFMSLQNKQKPALKVEVALNNPFPLKEEENLARAQEMLRQHPCWVGLLKWYSSQKWWRKFLVSTEKSKPVLSVVDLFAWKLKQVVTATNRWYTEAGSALTW